MVPIGGSYMMFFMMMYDWGFCTNGLMDHRSAMIAINFGWSNLTIRQAEIVREIADGDY